MKGRNLRYIVIAVIFIILILVVFSYFSLKARDVTPKHNSANQNTLPYQDIGSNAANELSHQLTNSNKVIQSLQAQVNDLESQMKAQQGASNTNDNAGVKEYLNSAIKQVQDEINKFKNQKPINSNNQAPKSNLSDQGQSYTNTQSMFDNNNDDSFNVGDGDSTIPATQQTTSPHTVWISDQSLQTDDKSKQKLFAGTPSTQNPDIFENKDKKKKPAFTIPNPTVFTGVTFLNDLVGRVPTGNDHSIYTPYEATFVVGRKNITSKDFSLPPEVDHIMGVVVCMGDIMSSSVSCKVKTLTYIFPDGTISTVGGDSKNSSTDQSYGYISTATGSPQIPGTRYSSLGLRLAGVGLSGAVSGIGAAVSQGGLTTLSNQGTASLFTSIKNVPLYAAGQGINNASSEASKEFENYFKNVFDYVVARAYNDKTKSLKKFNVVITKQVDFDYDKHGRKLDHHLVNVGQQDMASNIF